MKLRLRQRAQQEFSALEATMPSRKISHELTPNLRALRLAMMASDVLLSMGISANSVVSRALDITEAYCDQPVHIDIISNVIMLSQLRDMESEPLTLMRPVVLRDTNNMTIQSVQQLIYHIRQGMYTLDEAEAELDKIVAGPITYPVWLITTANASIAAGVALMFSTNWRIVAVTFVIAAMVDRLVILLTNRAISAFFRQAAAGAFVTLAAAVIALLARNGIEFFAGMNPTLIVVGGIIMLLAGLAIVSAIQDAIEEYYITASARVLKVAMLTAGIVMGVLIGLYAARKTGMGIAVSPNPLHLTGLHFQVAGGAIAAAAYAVATQTRLRAIAWAGLMGAGALLVLYLTTHLGISVIPGSGVAAVVVGVLASFFSYYWRTPASGIIAAGIIPLVPGLALYNGLMQLVNYPPGDPLFFSGLGTLFAAMATALSIAAGASFGNMLAKPLHRQLTYARNFEPFADFMRWQLRNERTATRIAQEALRRSTAGFRPPRDKHDE
jgi:uncharacterized membrane protein YjjP (DUF1212 family)